MDELDRLGTTGSGDHPYSTLMKFRKLLCTSVLQNMRSLQNSPDPDTENLQMTIKCFHHCLKEFPSMFAFREPASDVRIVEENKPWHLSVSEHHVLSLAFSRWSVCALLKFLANPLLQDLHSDIRVLIIAIVRLLQVRDIIFFSKLLEEVLNLLTVLLTNNYPVCQNTFPQCEVKLHKCPEDVPFDKLRHLNEEERLDLPELPDLLDDPDHCQSLQLRTTELLFALHQEIPQFLTVKSRIKVWTILSLQIHHGDMDLKKASLEAVQVLTSCGFPETEDVVNYLLVLFETLITMSCSGAIYTLGCAVDVQKALASCCLTFLEESVTEIDISVFREEFVHTALECITQSLLKFRLVQVQSEELREAVPRIAVLFLRLLHHLGSHCQPFLLKQLWQVTFTLLADNTRPQSLMNLSVHLFYLTLQHDFRTNSSCSNKTDPSLKPPKRSADGSLVPKSPEASAEPEMFITKLNLLKKIITDFWQDIPSCKQAAQTLWKLQGANMAVEILLKAVILQTKSEEILKSKDTDDGCIVIEPFLPVSTVSLIVQSCMHLVVGNMICSELFQAIMDTFTILTKAQDYLEITLPLLNDICLISSAPWLDSIDNREYRDLKPPVLTVEMQNRWKNLNYVDKQKSLNVLAQLPAEVAPFWRLSTLASALLGPDTKVQESAVCNLPLHFHMLRLTAEKTVQDFVNSLRGSSCVSIQNALASTLGPLHCVLNGTTKLERVAARITAADYDLLLSRLTCRVCDNDLNKDRKNPGWLQDTLLEFLKHSDPETRKAAIQSCKFMFAHTKVTMDVLLAFLALVEDPDYSIRMELSESFRQLLKQHRLWTDNMNDTLAMHFRQKIVKAQMCGDSSLLDTLLCTVRHLGHTDSEELLNCALFTYLEYLQFPSLVLPALARTEIKNLAQSKNLNVPKFFRLHWQPICKYVVKDMLDEKNQDPLVLSYKITNLCEFPDIKIFLSNTVQFILPSVISSQSPKRSAIIKSLAKAMRVSKRDLLSKNFSYIFSDLVRHCSRDVMLNSLNFVQKETDYEVGTLIRLNLQRVHNELLLHLSTHRDKVYTALFSLAGREQDQKTPEDLANILEPRILAFLVFFDTQLLNSKISLAEKKLALQSLIAVINLMGPKHITTVRMKVMATLKIALRLTQQDFPRICCEAWSAFVKSIELPALGPMLNQVMATLLVLLKPEPQGVAKIFHFLIVDNRKHLKEYFHDLYFVPEIPELSQVIAVLRDFTEKPTSQNDFCSLILESQNGLVHESLDVRIHALIKLKKLLTTHQTDLNAHLLTQETLEPVISQLVTKLMLGCRETDQRVRLLLAEILGELGAVDPGRLEFKAATPKETMPHLYSNVDEENFAFDLIQELVRSFLAADDCRIQDCACYALQEMLEIYNCSGEQNSAGKKLWNRFSPDVQDTLKPYFQSRYIKASEMKQINYPRPICNSTLGKTFEDWTKNWTMDLLGKVQDEKAKRVFSACSKILQHCTNVALYLLPQLLVYVLRANEKKQVEEINCEFLGVLKLCEDSQLGTKKTTKSDLIHMSAQVVFTSLDHLRQWQQQFGSKPDSEGMSISGFLEHIPYDLLARAAFNCQAYTRSFMYLEIFLKLFPQEVDGHLGFLQKLYAALDEPDGVCGVSAARKNEPTLREQILEHETAGQLQEALACYGRSIKAEEDDVAHHQGQLRCLMGLDQAHAALKTATGILSESPHWMNEINPFSVEAAWKLGSWDKLATFLKKDSSSESWGVGVGRLLSSAVEMKTRDFFDNLKRLRYQSIGPLSAAAMENGAYQRGYSCLVKLHMLTDIQKGAEAFLNLFDPSEPISSSTTTLTVQTLLEDWKIRRKLVQSSIRFQEPVLNLQRVLLMLAESQHPNLVVHVQREMIHSWLQSAKLARKNSHQQRAFGCLLEASQKRLPQVFMERAKLLWDKGDQQQAIVVLQKGIQEGFPDFSRLTDNHEKLLCAKSKLMLSQYSEELSIVDSASLISMYKEVVNVQPHWEEGHFHLGRYYDRIIPTIDKAETKADVVLNAIRSFGQSLQFNCSHIYHSMPRLLALWFDLGSQAAEMSKSGSRSSSSITSQMDTATKYVSQLRTKLPAYHFLTAFPQLISRICHSHPGVAQQLQEIIAHILQTYPQQAMWMMIAVSKSSYQMRVDRCNIIFERACQQKPVLRKFITESRQFAEKLLELSNKQVPEPNSSSFSLSLHMKSLPKFIEDKKVSRILLPLQSQMTANLPSDFQRQFEHNPFPQNLVYIAGFLDKVEIMASMQKPKKITIRGSDGKLYSMMCKPKDDLRKDCRLMEFNNLVNKHLKKDSETRKRQLHIRTYTVVPLNEECGLVEWVPNLKGLREILHTIYKKIGKYTTGREIKAFMPQLNTPLEKKLSIYKEKFLPRHPPVFSEWFFETFPDPTAWYLAKLSYARTLAVMSMVGYVLGLGDRHGENILFDSSCGDTIHVDFNCLFNKGESFDWPERVPFRLTHNMIAALGPLGTEGVFRKTCEATLRVMRNQTDTLMSVLRPFIHDPLLEWGKTTKGSSRNGATSIPGTGEIENEKGVSHVRDIEHRLKGIIVKGKKKHQGLPLSIEGQVNYLIQEATNEINLCQMYVGWAAYM